MEEIADLDTSLIHEIQEYIEIRVGEPKSIVRKDGIKRKHTEYDVEVDVSPHFLNRALCERRPPIRYPRLC